MTRSEKMARPYATVAAARGRPKRATTGLTWTFRLRPALKFHDGELVLAPSASILTPPRKPESTHHAGNDTPAAFVGTGGRLQSERMAAFNRNPRPQSS